MNFIFVKYFVIFFFFHNQVCVLTLLTNKMSPEDALKQCIHFTGVTVDEANKLLHQYMTHPANIYEQCFLQCYFTYSNNITVGVIDDPFNKTASYNIVVTDVIPISVMTCIEVEKILQATRNTKKKCNMGNYTRSCYITFVNELADSLGVKVHLQ